MIEKKFAAVLKELRQEKKLSQEKLAELCDLDRTYISLLERGLRQPSLTTIFKSADALEIEPYQLIKKVQEKMISLNIEVTAAVILKEGKILLAKRAPAKHLAGYWEFPGGKIEADEEPAACLEREILEELGVPIKVNEFLLENEHQYERGTILLKSFLCELTSTAEFHLIDHDEVAWVEKEQLSDYKIAPADLPIIQELYDRNLL